MITENLKAALTFNKDEDELYQEYIENKNKEREQDDVFINLVDFVNELKSYNFTPAYCDWVGKNIYKYINSENKQRPVYRMRKYNPESDKLLLKDFSEVVICLENSTINNNLFNYKLNYILSRIGIWVNV